MTQIETPPRAPASSTPAPTATFSRSMVPWWTIAIGIGAVLVVIIGFAIANSGSSDSAFSNANVPVTTNDYNVTLPSTTLTTGTKTLQITNKGAVAHELLVFHPDATINPAQLPLDAAGDIEEEAAGVNKISDGDNIDPGASQTRQLDLSQPGTYVFVCNLPGHYKLGMWKVVTVR